MKTSSDDKLSILLHAALDLQRVGEYQQALASLQRASELAPENAVVYVLTGLTHQKLGAFKPAERAFRKALELEPDNNEALQSLGLLLIADDRLREAIPYLKKHLKQDPANPATLDVFIPALAKAGRMDDARKILLAAWERTQDADVAVRYARFLISHGLILDVIDFLRGIVDEVKNPRLYVELSLALVIAEKYQEAIEPLEKAIELDEAFDRAWRGLAHCYTQLGQGEKALEMAETALALNPRHYRNWQAKADALLLLERFEDARDAAQKGIDLIDPQDLEARPVLGVLYLQRSNALLRLNDVEGMLKSFAEARRVFPKDRRFYRYPAQILFQLRRFEEALALMEASCPHGIAWDEEEIDFLVAQGIDWYTSGQPKAALDWFERLLNLAPASPRLLNAVGFVATGEGNFQQAEEHLKKALDIEGEEYLVITLNDLGYLYLLQSRLEEAESALQKALDALQDDDVAFLRVAFVVDGKLIPDYDPHPPRSIRPHDAARANLAALALLRGDVPAALTIAQAIVAKHPEESAGHAALGCACLAQGQPGEAEKAWQQAMKHSQDEREREMVAAWLHGLHT